MLNTYPRYGVEFLSHMQAGQDSSNCLRRGECLPVGGLSVWSRIQARGTCSSRLLVELSKCRVAGRVTLR